MPQAIKSYNGVINGGDNTTIYTCPTSTIAIVIPNISINSTVANTKFGVGWTSSSDIGTDGQYSNFWHNNVDASQPLSIYPRTKYDIRLNNPYNSSDSRWTPGGDRNAFYHTNVQASVTGALGIGTIAGNSSTSLDNSFGTWIMAATHKLNLFTNNTSLLVHYNFLILEEAAS